MPKWSQILPPSVLKKGDELTLRAAQERAIHQIFPPQDQIFRALALTPPDKLKVCIIGQDPYHGDGQANGLAFSVNPGVVPPPSLENIFKELAADIGQPHPATGDLTPWAEQGVLLLNTSLTVQAHKPASHADWGWGEFTQAIVQTAVHLPQPIVFILWGAHARKFCLPTITMRKRSCKEAIVSSHPSPFSAYTASNGIPAFMGSRPFSGANNLLTNMGGTPVDWRLPT